MKKTIVFTSVLISFQLYVSAQNVGIGTTLPTQKLDVNGNINLEGNITVSGVAGTGGQALITTGSGATAWGDLCDLQNVASYSQNGSWTVPAGVTKVEIEAWGGGGGGATGGGGAGGTYIRSSTLNVTGGASINITVGTGGSGALSEITNAANGSQTNITGSFGTLTAVGGTGASTYRGGFASSVALGGDFLIQLAGQAGATTSYTYAQKAAGQFVEIRNFGSGGSVPPTYNNGGPGGCYVKDLSTALPVVVNEPAVFLKVSGTGGGGGFNSGGSGLWGAAGANGMVIIHY